MADKKTKPTNLSFHWKLELDYMTPTESLEIERLRHMERLTFYRIKMCAMPGCEKEIANVDSKRFCSRAHSEEAAKLAEESKRSETRAKFERIIGEVKARLGSRKLKDEEE